MMFTQPEKVSAVATAWSQLRLKRTEAVCCVFTQATPTPCFAQLLSRSQPLQGSIHSLKCRKTLLQICPRMSEVHMAPREQCTSALQCGLKLHPPSQSSHRFQTYSSPVYCLCLLLLLSWICCIALCFANHIISPGTSTLQSLQLQVRQTFAWLCSSHTQRGEPAEVPSSTWATMHQVLLALQSQTLYLNQPEQRYVEKWW